MHNILIIVLVYFIIKITRKNHFISIIDKDNKEIIDTNENGMKVSDGSVNSKFLNLVSDYYYNTENKIRHENLNVKDIVINDMSVTNNGSIESEDEIKVNEVASSSITVSKLIIGDGQSLCIGTDVCLSGEDIRNIKNNKEYCLYEENGINKYCITGDDIIALNKYDLDVSTPQGYIKGTYVQRKGKNSNSNTTTAIYYHLYPGNNELYNNAYTPNSYGTCYVTLDLNKYGVLSFNPGYRVIGRLKESIQLIIENNSSYVYNLENVDGTFIFYYNTDSMNKSYIPDEDIIYKSNTWYVLSSIELQKI